MGGEDGGEVVGFGVAPDHLFPEDVFVVDVDVEDPAGAGDDFDDFEEWAPSFKQRGDQPGRVRRGASGHAVFDANAVSGVDDHDESLPHGSLR